MFDPSILSVGDNDPLLTREGVRNNNPGNLRGQYFGATGNDGRFAQYATPEDGIGAMAHQLSRYYTGATTGKPLRTVSDIVSTYAPGNENNTAAYIDDVSKRMNVAPTDKLDLRDPSVMASLTQAIIHHENGGQPYNPNFVLASVSKAVPGFTGASQATAPNQPDEASMTPDDQQRLNALLAQQAQEASGNGPPVSAQLPPNDGQPAYASIPPSYTGPLPTQDVGAPPDPQPLSNEDQSSAWADQQAPDPPQMQPPQGMLPQMQQQQSQAPAQAPQGLFGRLGEFMFGKGDQSSASTPTTSQQSPQSHATGMPTGDISQDPTYGPLANKAFWAGMLGNKGIVGGALAGQAGVMKDRIDNSVKLQQMNMLAGNRQMQNFDMLVKTGMNPSAAAKAAGINYPQDVLDQMDTQSNMAKPMPAGALKMEQNNLDAVGEQRTFQNQAARYADMIKGGEFHMDPAHRTLYNSLNAVGVPTQAAVNYKQFQAFLENARQNIVNANKGASSDKRTDAAMAALTGGGSLGSDSQAVSHLDMLGNQSALAEKNLRTRVDASRAAVKRPSFWSSPEGQNFDQNLAPSQYQGTTAAQNAQGLIGGSEQRDTQQPGNQFGVGETRSIGGVAVRRIQ